MEMLVKKRDSGWGRGQGQAVTVSSLKDLMGFGIQSCRVKVAGVIKGF